MIVFLQCVAEAIVANGIRGLSEMVPGGPFACAVAEHVWENYRSRVRSDQVRAEFEQLAGTDFDEAELSAAAAVRAVANDAPADERERLGLYLTQLPSEVRQTLQRPDDPTGRTAPATFALRSRDDVLAVLPPRPPRFRRGDAIPGRPGWQLVRPLGVGGFGEVWLCRNAHIGATIGGGEVLPRPLGP